MRDMPGVRPIAARIAQLKGNMTYTELSDAIYAKTGIRVSDRGLQHLGSGAYTSARPKTMQALMEYANQPAWWFYTDDSSPMAWDHQGYDITQGGQNPPPIIPNLHPTEQEQANLDRYLAPTGDELIDLTKKQLLYVLLYQRKRPTEENLGGLAHIARMIAADIRALKS